MNPNITETSTNTESSFQIQTITTVIKIGILGALLFLFNTAVVFIRTGRGQALNSFYITLCLLIIGLTSLWLINTGHFKQARAFFIGGYYLRIIQLMFVVPENLFPISVMYMTLFIVVSIFLFGENQGIFWVIAGVVTTIAVILIRPFTNFPNTSINDPVIYDLALYFLPLACMGTISLLCLYIYRRFQKALLESQEARLQLERTNRTLENFAYVASHDMQEPLRTIACHAQLIEMEHKGKLGESSEESLGYLIDGAQRMQKLIKDLLLYSRLKTRALEPETISLKDTLDQVKKNLALRLQETQAILTIGEMPTLQARPSQMIQLFQNLISNSLKFRSEEPLRIEVSTSRKGNEWLFSIKDNGIGIPHEEQEGIFRPFERAHNHKQPGTGIGLAICLEIVETHQGRIWAESHPGQGSTFFFTLPAATEKN